MIIGYLESLQTCDIVCWNNMGLDTLSNVLLSWKADIDISNAVYPFAVMYNTHH